MNIGNFIAAWSGSFFGCHDGAPWAITAEASEIIRAALKTLDEDYRQEGDIAVHSSAVIESGSVIKGPAIIGPESFVAANAYLRGGVFLGKGAIIGPSCELKSTFMFEGAKAAHLNFVGDSLIGARVNIEAGAVIANYRNECDDKRIRILHRGGTIDAGVQKFGALVGDGVRIGANAVVAPGAIIEPGFILPRLALLDQSPAAGVK